MVLQIVTSCILETNALEEQAASKFRAKLSMGRMHYFDITLNSLKFLYSSYQTLAVSTQKTKV